MRSLITSLAVPLLPGVIHAQSSSANRLPRQLLEPVVKRYVHILPKDACDQLIALGEEDGFNEVDESIDEGENPAEVGPSQSIEVYERNRGVTAPAIWEALEPWIPKLTELVKESIDVDTDAMYYPDKQPDRTPSLDWVFFRKYSPRSDRNSLKPHADSNMHTLNIALNHDFEGGGLFYVKPPADQEIFADYDTATEEEEEDDERPDIPWEYKEYSWLNRLKRENTSDLVFPMLEGGDVLIHNFTVWHAVAPLEKGTRYSFVLFYDMDNPAIQDDFKLLEGGDEDEEEDGAFDIVFYHEITNVDIDLEFINIIEEEDRAESILMEEKMPPYKKMAMESYVGHVFRAYVSGTDELIQEFAVTEGRRLYTIEMDHLEDEDGEL